VVPEVLSMLKTWLVNHIKGDDADYVETVVKSLGVELKHAETTGGWLGGMLKKIFG